MTNMTLEQYAAVCAFAAANGRCWRDKLRTLWMNGGDVNQPDGCYLRQVRNSIGPSGLEKVCIHAEESTV